MIQLYKDTPGETLTETGERFRKDFSKILQPILSKALKEDVSLHDLRDALTSELSLQIAISFLKKAINKQEEK